MALNLGFNFNMKHSNSEQSLDEFIDGVLDECLMIGSARGEGIRKKRAITLWLYDDEVAFYEACQERLNKRYGKSLIKLVRFYLKRTRAKLNLSAEDKAS